MILAWLGCASVGFTAAEWDLLLPLALPQRAPPETDDPVFVLGRALFHDATLSQPDGGPAVSCAGCHDVLAGTDDPAELPRSLTATGGLTARNAPSLLDSADRYQWGWYGQYATMTEQIGFPVLGKAGNCETKDPTASVYNTDWAQFSLGVVVGHGSDYHFAFGDDPSVCENSLAALAHYVAQIRSEPSALDAVLTRGDPTDTAPMTAAEVAGARLFVGRGGCLHCHGGPYFSDGRYHNTAVHDDQGDLGRAALFDEAERAPQDLGAFQTPTLRGVAQTGPYFHTGGAADLWEVLDHYQQGGDAAGEYQGSADRAMTPLTLTVAEGDDLVAFLGSLRGLDPALEEPLLLPDSP